MKILIIPLLLVVMIPREVHAQRYSPLEQDRSALSLRQAAALSLTDATREDRCLRTGRSIGTFAGGAMGVFTLYLGTQGELDGPYWKTLAIGIPATIIGAYIGSRSSEWVTRKLLDARKGIGGSALRGAAYGFLDGVVTGIASMVPVLGLGYLLGVIEFNDDIGLLGVLGAATIGGAVFGGMIGVAAGFVYGPGISIYMKF